MRSLHRRFLTLESENPNLSTYMVFAATVKNQEYNRGTIEEWFEKLVDKDDYKGCGVHKTTLINQLVKLGNGEIESMVEQK